MLSMYHVDEGDIAYSFQGSREIFEDIYTRKDPAWTIIEPHAALAYWEPSGKLVIYTSTQNPSLVRARLADLFNLPQSKCVSSFLTSAAAMARKRIRAWSQLTATLARKAYRPVQWVLTAGRGFLDGSLSGRGGADQDRREEKTARIVARQVEAAYDARRLRS